MRSPWATRIVSTKEERMPPQTKKGAAANAATPLRGPAASSASSIGGDLLSHGAAPAVPSARGGLNFRVRHGAGCAPAAKAADRRGRRERRRALRAAWRSETIAARARRARGALPLRAGAVALLVPLG